MFESDHTDPAYIAQREARAAIFRILLDAYGPDAIVRRPISAELDIPVPVPAVWTQGIRAARAVGSTATAFLRTYVHKARGSGASWAELADPLGVTTTQTDPATAAFEAIARTQSNPFDPVTTSWRCESCDELITDHGPYNGHPADCETGHHPNCTRHQAEITAYLVERDGEVGN